MLITNVEWNPNDEEMKEIMSYVEERAFVTDHLIKVFGSAEYIGGIYLRDDEDCCSHTPYKDYDPDDDDDTEYLIKLFELVRDGWAHDIQKGLYVLEEIYDVDIDWELPDEVKNQAIASRNANIIAEWLREQLDCHVARFEMPAELAKQIGCDPIYNVSEE